MNLSVDNELCTLIEFEFALRNLHNLNFLFDPLLDDDTTESTLFNILNIVYTKILIPQTVRNVLRVATGFSFAINCCFVDGWVPEEESS